MGYMQAIRVGVTNALSAKYLARKDSSVMALYGSGWQAGPALLAMCKVLPIEEVRVYSPTRENRETFVEKMSEKTQRELARRVVSGRSGEGRRYRRFDDQCAGSVFPCVVDSETACISPPCGRAR